MRLRTIVLAAIWGLGCSTLEPKFVPSACTGDDDCEEGEGCPNGFCVPNDDIPPQVYVGFDLEEIADNFRVEVAGCDREVEGVRVLQVPRSQLTLFLDLFVFKEEPPTDPDLYTREHMLDANLVLTQPGRFGREGQQRDATAPTLVGETIVATRFRWPRYHPNNLIPALPEHLQPLGHILWRIEPLPGMEDTEPPPAPLYLNLTPPIPGGTLGDELNPLRTCSLFDSECCPAENPDCEPEETMNACVQVGTGIDGVTSGVCRAVGNGLAVYTHRYAFECDRPIEARVIRVDPDTLANLGGLAGAEVSLRHADGANPVTLPAIDVIDPELRPVQCMRDDACVPETQTCNTQTGQCEARITGLRATSGNTPNEPEGEEPGIFRSRVFTYCDPLVNEPLTRSYNVRISAPDETGLPPVLYEVGVGFDPLVLGGAEPVDIGGEKAFCVPDWGPPSTVLIEPVGEPVTLLTVGSDPYTCCNIDCLPTDPMAPPPDTPDSCAGSGSGESAPTVDIATQLKISPAQATEYLAPDSPCVPPTTDSEGVVGVLRRVAECGQDEASPGVCALEAVPGNATQPRRYSVRVEPPTGSVLGSVDAEFTLGSEPLPEPVRIALPQRRVVRGRVVLSSEICALEEDNDCGSEGAKVLAERLRVEPESEANTPGPYFHEVATFTDPEQGDGAYVLPLDPGVWVMTALPDRGTAGGPALLTVVDLRETDSEPVNFTLEPGILVTLDINSFDLRSSVLPLDIGSWRFQGDLLHPDRALDETADPLLDLMAPGECLGESGDSSQGCRIRRLVSGTSLTPTQVGQVRFTARDLKAEAARVCIPPGE